LQTSRVRPRGGLPGAVQFIGVELALAAAAIAFLVRRPGVPLAAGLTAGLLLVMVLGRADGRWWYEAVAAQLRLRRRRALGRQVASRMTGAPTGTVALATLAPGLAVRSFTDRGRSIGIGQDADGWFAGVRLGAGGDVSGLAAARFELDKVIRVLDESTMPVSALQLVSYHLPVPVGEAPEPALRSYRELTGNEYCPAEQITWVMVRLHPPDAVEAAWSRGGGIEGVDRALAAAVGRIENALSAASVPYRVLDAPGLHEAIAVSCGLASVDPTAVGEPPRERWSAWSAVGLNHICFSISRWPREPGPDLLRELARVSATAVGVALILRPHGDRVAMLGVVRLVTGRTGTRAAVRQLQSATRRLGVRLRRLDGEQARAVYATAPTGAGGIPWL
jgi:type VII secretion protein EccE